MNTLTRRNACALLSLGALAASQPAALNLSDLSGKRHTFPVAGKTTVVVFYSTICPISNEYNERIARFHREYSLKGVQVLVANANQNEPKDQIEKHTRDAEFEFPVFIDSANAVADRLKASVTPEAFVLDSKGVVRYHGPIDDARNIARIKAHLLRDAVDAVLAGKPVARPEAKAFGCTIKRVRKT
ncbi:MAG: redoxin domain-containing protein [Acidobacteria bacterium]|nr:redoxin domain-containing protein [Acidobacteriota bacterium]